MTKTLITRRSILAGLLAAPVVVQASSLMKIKGTPLDPLVRVQTWSFGTEPVGFWEAYEGPRSLVKTALGLKDGQSMLAMRGFQRAVIEGYLQYDERVLSPGVIKLEISALHWGSPALPEKLPSPGAVEGRALPSSPLLDAASFKTVGIGFSGGVASNSPRKDVVEKLPFYKLKRADGRVVTHREEESPNGFGITQCWFLGDEQDEATCAHVWKSTVEAHSVKEAAFLTHTASLQEQAKSLIKWGS